MKVVAFNGSARKNGNTKMMLETALAELQNEGVETELIHIGNRALHGCMACGKCRETLNQKCIIDNDPINEWIAKMVEADGILLGSPTYFANVSTEMKALIDRAGVVCRGNGDLLKRKVGAPVAVARRGGAMQVYNTLMAFFGIAQVVVPSSSYWNMGFGLGPGDVEDDAEGLKTMTDLGQNMAWLLKKIHA